MFSKNIQLKPALLVTLKSSRIDKNKKNVYPLSIASLLFHEKVLMKCVL